MKVFLSRQLQDFEDQPTGRFNPKVKCVTMAIYEKEGKTVLQPLVAEQEAKCIPELFRNETLEVWLSNGKSDISAFDVAILKYKLAKQTIAKCDKVCNQVCLKNMCEDIVHCEQCPLNPELEEN